MAWEHADKIFPNGITPPLEDGNIITTTELKARDDIPYISVIATSYARKMLVKLER